MKSVESDWFGHITWRGGRGDQRCLSYKGLDKKVLRLAIWQHITHIFDLLKHESNTPNYRLESWSS